jgi:penicillin-binding protein 2
VLGTLGEISANELSKRAEKGYRPGDLVGKSGIERKYEPSLKGVEGWEQIEINAQGLQLGSQAIRAPVPGADVVLTVDASLQRFVEEAFVDRAGSVIVVDPDSGRILAMVSEPGFDLNLFSPSITRRQWRDLGHDPLHPLENRSIRGLYSPASTFKIVTAAAALAENVVTPKTTFTCKGELELAGQRFRCWKPHGHGKVSLHRAIIESCDIYFYQLGLRLGGNRIARYASLCGLGKPTGLELPGELPGLIPTSAWKLRTYGESWKDGETLNLAIGQGYLVSTPIQMAMMTAALANGGNLLQPAIVRQIRAADGRIIFDHVPVLRWKIPLNDEERSLLHDAMIGVVSEKGGTGKKCRIPGITVAGKTGTSQVIRHRHRPAENMEVPYHERSHAIFVAYVDDMPKKIAVVVVVEHGGGGGKSAAPLARKIICRYYGAPDPGEPKE